MERIGNYLYKHGVIGYVTLEFITFQDNQKVKYHCNI